jgi:hypothetical protein
MSVRLSPTQMIELYDECPSEDAEVLLRYLLAAPATAVDWSACAAAHTAVIQVLLFARPTMHGVPAGQILRTWIQPLLISGAA